MAAGPPVPESDGNGRSDDGRPDAVIDSYTCPYNSYTRPHDSYTHANRLPNAVAESHSDD